MAVTFGDSPPIYSRNGWGGPSAAAVESFCGLEPSVNIVLDEVLRPTGLGTGELPGFLVQEPLANCPTGLPCFRREALLLPAFLPDAMAPGSRPLWTAMRQLQCHRGAQWRGPEAHASSLRAGVQWL
eukprot:scaffold517_cov392-Prasinococcus_capsulatus_cf.AAC.11